MRSSNNNTKSAPPPAGISLSTKARRRPRTTPIQRKLLEAAFQQDPYPNRDRQLALAADVGFSVESLHFWFQNQRQFMRRQAKYTKQERVPAGGGSTVAATHGHAQSPFSTAPSGVVPGTPHQQRQQDEERYTFYSPNAIQPPPAPHISMSSPSMEDNPIGYYSAPTTTTSSAGSGDMHGFQQQQQQLRLPPFSTLVPQQEQQQEQQHTGGGGGMGSTAAAAAAAAVTASTGVGGFSSASSTCFAPSAFTPTRPVPLPASSSPLVIQHQVPPPGSAASPPIHFYFHHPEYGIEACMRQLSSRIEKVPSTRNLHRY